MKDRDEEHYDHEESEYHFSDDDVSYEVEAETSKPAMSEPEKKNPMASLSQSKRMMISLVVFLGLVFVVYKMVSPGTTIPSTDISPVATTQTITQEIAPPPLPHTTAQAPMQTESVPVQSAPTQAAVAPQSTAPTQPEPMAAQSQPIASAPAPAPAPATTTTTTTVATAPAQPVAAAPQAVQPSAPVAPQPVAQVAPAQPAALPAPLTTPVAAAPAPTNVPVQQPMPVATTVVTTPAPVTPSNTDATIAAMAATNEKLMNQLQAEYSQKVTDFSNQTRVLQDNMQALNSRVAGLESQLSQLVQTLSRQAGMGGTTSLNVVPAQQPAPIVQPKVSYNVQAIIPGRAWLKSDNGETLTVAEGDTIRELGRVMKIDPYDGVVEVNTGNKTVSISYGSGG